MFLKQFPLVIIVTIVGINSILILASPFPLIESEETRHNNHETEEFLPSPSPAKFGHGHGGVGTSQDKSHPGGVKNHTRIHPKNHIIGGSNGSSRNCNMFARKSCLCKMMWKPLCGSDNITYASLCHFQCAQRCEPSEFFIIINMLFFVAF